jgi:GT2 family glycosyltransferase
MPTRLGVVAIGRNEGERLARSLTSVVGRADSVVYVDSGSTDGSVERARGLGVTVVELDRSQPFTAARARNAGFAELIRQEPELEFVQFVDGDCELQPGWLENATRHLEHHPRVGVACGRRRERFPDASPYNRLADMEWDTPVGNALACGGDALIRAPLLRQVGGYNEGLIAGEDPELCQRIRYAGFEIVRLDHEMTLHDAAMKSFRQWWRRMNRSGHAYAEVLHLQGRSPQKHNIRKVLSIVGWGGILPALCLLAAPSSGGASLALLLAIPLLGSRIYRSSVRRGAPPADARLYAVACTLGKFAEMQGVLTFLWNRLVRRRRSTLIEYK